MLHQEESTIIMTSVYYARVQRGQRSLYNSYTVIEVQTLLPQ